MSIKKLKGKNEFTAETIKKLEELIVLRIKTPASGQKSIRNKIRSLGFYGQDDWGIKNMQVSDLHSLIDSGKIKIIDEGFKTRFKTSSNAKPKNFKRSKSIKTFSKGSIDFGKILETFKENCFDPKSDQDNKIDDSRGNYIICLRKKSKLPAFSISPILKTFDGLNVIYTGIASVSLRSRDFRQHFKGNNAGRSTLRKSLGVLFGFKLIPRDRDPKTSKTKFGFEDELELTEWMLENLKIYFLPTEDFKSIEIELIKEFNPPLNLKDNHNSINENFRRLLSNLRSNKGK